MSTSVSVHVACGLVLLAIAGAFDTVSAIARSTILQTVTPDRLRGRANAANSMVVVGGPMLGDLRAGAMGGLVSPGFSLVFGGAVCVAACAVIARVFPALADYDPPPAPEVTALARDSTEHEPI
jgi:MFS family permease